jgi:hypothetical protein
VIAVLLMIIGCWFLVATPIAVVLGRSISEAAARGDELDSLQARRGLPDALRTDRTGDRRPRPVTRYLNDKHRVQANISVDEAGCWNWIRHRDSDGYGRLTAPSDGRRRNFAAHRFSYQVYVGPIPPGLTLDHLCRNRACVNPAHLEPVTIGTNLSRSPVLKELLRGYAQNQKRNTGDATVLQFEPPDRRASGEEVAPVRAVRRLADTQLVADFRDAGWVIGLLAAAVLCLAAGDYLYALATTGVTP